MPIRINEGRCFQQGLKVKRSRFYILVTKTSGYLLLPPVLLALPVDYFDTGPSLCLSKLLAGIECFGCGMTRAIMHLIHLDLAGAAAFNKGCFIVFPVLGFLWTKWFLQDYTRLQRQRRHLREARGGEACNTG
jgi:hypothetical protein